MNGMGVDAVAHALELDVVGRLVGGENGAVAVTDADGAAWVLKVFELEEETTLGRAIEIAGRMRSRGVPVPAPYQAGAAAGHAYTLQRRCAGEVPEVLTAAHARQLLEFWTRHAGAVPEGGEWPEAVIGALTEGDRDLWAEHAPIRATGGDAVRLLDEILAVGASADPAVLRRRDARHGDWHHRNVLVVGDLVEAVIDWESAGAGDARVDLVLLDFWTHVYAGTGVSQDAAALVRAATDAHVEPRARRILAAYVAVHQLWFVCAHRPERLPSFLPELERHLAWQWRAPVR
jgi:aminoglycoside phosphotransferase (APT) family kinase protein